MARKVAISTFVKELEAALNRKDGYIMGSRGQNPRTGKLDLSATSVSSSWKENGWYYTQYSGTQREHALNWRKKCTRVWDCNGMAEGIYEIHTGINIDSKARFNYAQWCDPKGSGMIPAKYRVPGAAIFWSNGGSSDIHHVAYLWKPVDPNKPDGDWYIIEARGVAYGVVSARLNSRRPNFWGWMTKYYDYTGSTEDVGVIEEPKAVKLGDRELSNGLEGSDVKELQTNLIRMGYDCGKWGADGEFGDCTEMAVRAFQDGNGLKVNGIFDKVCYDKMHEVLSNKVDAPVENPMQVKIFGGQCYIRSKSNTTGATLGVAKEGSVWEYAGETSENGWNKIVYKNKPAWVSGKYSKLIK